MSMESDTTVSHGVTQPNSEPKPLKPELTFEPVWEKSTPEGSHEIIMRECYKGLEDYFNLRTCIFCYEGKSACIMQTRRNDHQWWLVVFNLSESSNCPVAIFIFSCSVYDRHGR
ncbi:hypothetical protein P8452_08774 [Trifolium repens]|jgi:hypothetical protein|nr:hypothetical protein QL285_090606 [Trifolium repens]KAK2436616.1 hypothetical protein QL285_021601 [Trifolium repens]WJX19039.1 hypothetical protein P8452_08774 [Trifolium repens]